METVVNGVYSQYTQFTVLFHVYKFWLSFWKSRQSLSWLNKNEIPRNQKVHFCYTTFLCHATFNHSVHTIPPTDDNCQRQTLWRRILRAWFLSSWIYCEIMKLHCYKKAEAVWMKSGSETVLEPQWENVSYGSIHPLGPCPTSSCAVKTSFPLDFGWDGL